MVVRVFLSIIFLSLNGIFNHAYSAGFAITPYSKASKNQKNSTSKSITSQTIAKEQIEIQIPTRFYGLNRPNLEIIGNSYSPATLEQANQLRNKIISDISKMGVRWFRDGFSSPTHGVEDFVNTVKNAKRYDLKMLAVIRHIPADFRADFKPQNAGAAFKNICGIESGSYPLSEINLSQFQKRLKLQFDALKKAELEVDAFEIGNELDWVCSMVIFPFSKKHLSQN
jgi:hypothetical protein